MFPQFSIIFVILGVAENCAFLLKYVQRLQIKNELFFTFSAEKFSLH